MDLSKEQLKEKLQQIEEQEELEKENARKQKNYENFKRRPADWMIGRAHADQEFITNRYSSHLNKLLLPCSVSITGNCGETFRGTAPITSATQTYFRNVWNTNYNRDEDVFQEKLNKLVQEEVERICRRLPVVLEMMGLQSNHYWVTAENFPEDKLAEINKDIEDAQAEILDKYSDEEFLALIRTQHGYKDSNSGEPVPPFKDTDLSHGGMILFRYIFHHRPTLQKAFKKCRIYKGWTKEVTK